MRGGFGCVFCERGGGGLPRFFLAGGGGTVRLGVRVRLGRRLGYGRDAGRE